MQRFRGRRPLDWTRGAGRPRADAPARVDVIVPIYGAAGDLRRCLESVVAHTDLTRHRLVLVVDGPQDDDVELVIATHRDAALVLRNDERRGFSTSVNRGMAASRGDVVLLNSDAIVTPRWLEKMIEAAYTSGDAGTVTPLSNHATLCSVPRAFEENLLPSGFDVDSFAQLVESVSARMHPRIPTGVGFCFYIRRALLDDIGSFDVEHFPLGYGEENDFCMRALARGWVHVADDATFVFHAGHRSFGPTRAARERRARAMLTKRHPRYMATIAAFMRADPLLDARTRILSALGTPKPAAQLRVAHLVHGWPPFQHGGTELYAYWLASRQRERHEVSVYARGADPARGEHEVVELVDRGVRVRVVTNHFTSRNPLRRNAIRDPWLERDFERFLREQRPHLLHVHHLAGHSFSLPAIARRLGIPIVMQVQDWWPLCARVNLLHRDGTRCTGPAPAKCADCVTLTRLPKMNRVVHALRRSAARRALHAAGAYIAGSHAIRADYLQSVPPSIPFHVIPYGVAIEPVCAKRAATRRPIRFGCVGAIGPHKGIHVAVEAMRDIDPYDATLHLWGDVFPAYAAGMNAVFEGTFREEDKPRVYASIDVLIVPSIGLESFGLAAREALACGVPVIATAGGALSEIEGAEFFPAGDVDALRAILQRIVRDPGMVDRWRERLPVVKHESAHAEEIEQVYRSVLAARNRGGGVATALLDVLRGEGVASAVRRVRERMGEREPALSRASVLNVSFASVAPRTGGVAVQLQARLRAERRLRDVALLHPVRDVREALSITGARAIHLEGASEAPLDEVLRWIESDISVVISLHDYALFCARPNLIEQPMQRFCFYSRDLDRCARCLGDPRRNVQVERRELGRRVLESARGVIFPSQFLLDKHRELFGVSMNAEVIEPAVPAADHRVRVADERTEVAFAGNVRAHKGAHFLPEIAAVLAKHGRALHVFGGGDVDLLRTLRRMPNVVVHGYYRSDALPSLLAKHRVGLMVLPSIFAETYSITLSEAWIAGASVAAFDFGAAAERIRRDGGGWLAPLESGAAGIAQIVETWLTDKPAPIAPRKVQSPMDAARAHIELYRRWGLL